MRRLIGMATLVAAWSSACFPDPPKVEETSGDADTTVADTVEPETGAGDVAPVDTSGADTGGPDTSPADTGPADTSPADTSPADADTTDTTLAETSTPDGEVGDTSEPDAPAPDAEEVIVPECDGPEDCVHLTATCVEGACDSGACVARALTGTGCDDGDACTTDDRCEAGACGGTPVVCTARDQCHDVGVCDTRTGECSNPALSDIACDDEDPCTQDDVCSDGVCAGSAVACAAKDQCHEVGVCNPDTGVCSDPVRNDGVGCDDGDKCTQGDVCAAGVCGGSPVVCVALDQCHLAGVCDPGTGVCSSPMKNDGTQCDDGDPCTPESSCFRGGCLGSGTPSDAERDWAVSLVGEDHVMVVGLTLSGDGTIWALVTVRGATLQSRSHLGVSQSFDMPAGATESLVLVDLSLPDFPLVYPLLWTDSPPSELLVSSIAGLRALIDGTFLVHVAMAGPVKSLDGRTLGVSPSGFEMRAATAVLRFTDEGVLKAATQYLNAVGDEEARLVALTPVEDGSHIVSFTGYSTAMIEVVSDDLSSEVITPSQSGGERFRTFLERRTLIGDLLWRLRLDPAVPNGDFGIASIRAAAVLGDELILAGWATHPVIASLDGGTSMSIATDSGGVDGFLLRATGAGELLGFDQFFVTGAGGVVVPLHAQRGTAGIRASFMTTGPVSVRNGGNSPPTVVTQLGPDGYGFPGGVVLLSTDLTGPSLLVSDLVAGDDAEVTDQALVGDMEVKVGVYDYLTATTGGGLGVPEAWLKGHFVRVRRGNLAAMREVFAYDIQDQTNAANGRLAPQVRVAASPDGAVWVGGYVHAPVTVGRLNRVAIENEPERYSGYVVRLNSENEMLCE